MINGYVEVKKAGVIIIFLLTIIGGLIYASYRNNDRNLKILVISTANNVKDYSQTKVVWDDVNSMEESDLKGAYEGQNTEYMQVTRDKDLDDNIVRKFLDKNVVILVGDKYNSRLNAILNNNSRTKFILVNNSYNDRGMHKNLFKMNLNWETYFQKAIGDAYNDSKKIVYLYNKKIENKTNEEQHNLFLKMAKERKLQVLEIDLSKEDYKNQISDAYSKNQISVFVSVDFSRQQELATALKDMQKQNVYNVDSEQKKEKQKKDKDENNKEKEEKEKFLGIKFYGIYENMENIGEYDYMLNDERIQKNIYPFDVTLRYKIEILNIILEKSNQHKFVLTTLNGGIAIQKIEDKNIISTSQQDTVANSKNQKIGK